MNKKTLVTLALIIIGVLGVVTLGYALLTSNMLTLTPQVTSLLLEADTLTPNVGESVTLTATIVGTTMDDVTVTFYGNTLVIGSADTVAGVATLVYPVNNYLPVSVYATAP